MKSNLQTSNRFDFFKCDVLELLGCDIQATLKKKNPQRPHVAIVFNDMYITPGG